MNENKSLCQQGFKNLPFKQQRILEILELLISYTKRSSGELLTSKSNQWLLLSASAFVSSLEIINEGRRPSSFHSFPYYCKLEIGSAPTWQYILSFQQSAFVVRTLSTGYVGSLSVCSTSLLIDWKTRLHLWVDMMRSNIYYESLRQSHHFNG